MLVTVNFGQAYREFSCPEEINWQKLSEQVAQMFGKEVNDIHFTYLDDENDPVNISSDIELQEAKLLAEGLLRFQISAKSNGKDDSKTLLKIKPKVCCGGNLTCDKSTDRFKEPMEKPSNPEEKKINVQTQTAQATSEIIWNEICCDGCNVFPIKGVRYQCMFCPNFDLCEACEAKGLGNSSNHNDEHFLIKMKKPLVYPNLDQQNPIQFSFTIETDIREQIEEAKHKVSNFALQMEKQAQEFISQSDQFKEKSQLFLQAYSQRIQDQEKYYQILARKCRKEARDLQARLKEELKQLLAKKDQMEKAERLERHERYEKERIEKERLEKEHLEKERLEKERLEKERLEKERLEKEQLEKERLEKERLEEEKVRQEREDALKRQIEIDRTEQLKKAENAKIEELKALNAKLFEMGFLDTDRNLGLLTKYDHDIMQVIRDLLG